MEDVAAIAGNKDYQVEVVKFTAGDGFTLNLLHISKGAEPTKGPVLLVHGAGVRAQIFCAPTKTTLVDVLLEAGYDVWLENWRASIDFQPNAWTLDQAAAYDHPMAVKTVLEKAGAKTMKAVIHCQGSTSFTMSAMAGLVPEVTTIVTNAVSSHPVIPGWSKVKLTAFLPFIDMTMSYLNPQWGLKAPRFWPKIINFFVQLTHHECRNPVCKQVSFTYGAGFPALWKHYNLSPETHDWMKQEFKHVPISFFNQIMKCVDRGNLIAVDGIASLPQDFTAQAPKTDARMAFFAGELNQCFTAESQVKAYEWWNKQRPDYHTLNVIPKYSHLDIFMGSEAQKDVFPLMMKELET